MRRPSSPEAACREDDRTRAERGAAGLAALAVADRGSSRLSVVAELRER